ncbi:MAG: hypothetical protein A3F54_02260 [Candidatus Kerfeldbacteria bacterium RIFCSPHIGHO2_12_FULL_48_17]|uniref:DUF5668 domain-containing protein n=1 Tax=Candidatus Kerfeldbacteria bacterium RIFCSPHIGHO2_12_FULL_48_17 TaxID=1798542 RepID=A0A1G2AZI3_9BACT|nr:MAG: hypothetical protein A3F54_02260 [Candidatus Kerfeldbacteria bacterium RIFCSPHIGHO2_12_FULL_48_17]
MAKSEKSSHNGEGCWHMGSGSMFWGFLLLVVGGYFFARESGIITIDFPFWSFIVMVFGLWLILKSMMRS